MIHPVQTYSLTFGVSSVQVTSEQKQVDNKKKYDALLRPASFLACTAFSAVLILGSSGLFVAWILTRPGADSNSTLVGYNTTADITNYSPLIDSRGSSWFTSECDNSTAELTALATFFLNETCLRALNVNDSACPIHKANEFIDTFAGGWQIESEIGNVLALICLVLLMQLGGIPRPSDSQGVVEYHLSSCRPQLTTTPHLTRTLLYLFHTLLIPLLHAVFQESFSGASGCSVRFSKSSLLRFH